MCQPVGAARSYAQTVIIMCQPVKASSWSCVGTYDRLSSLCASLFGGGGLRELCRYLEHLDAVGFALLLGDDEGVDVEGGPVLRQCPAQHPYRLYVALRVVLTQPAAQSPIPLPMI